jgi:hypothetical protein
MNERIQELAEQAWRATSDEVAHLNRIHNRSYSQDEITDIFEIKFAELIFRELLELFEAAKVNQEDDVDYGLEEAQNIIKEHFGVEE